MRRVAAALLVASACALGAGCGPPGDSPYAGWKTYEEPDGTWRILYLSPPWKMVETDGASATLGIESTAEAAGFVESSVPSKYLLEITVEPGAARARADADVATAARRMETVVEPVAPFETRSGDEGVDLVTQSLADPMRPRYVRYVYLPHPRGVLRLHLSAYPRLDEPEVDTMLRSAEVITP